MGLHYMQPSQWTHDVVATLVQRRNNISCSVGLFQEYLWDSWACYISMQAWSHQGGGQIFKKKLCISP